MKGCLSRRKLAAHLGISVNTVDSAYSQLLSEGFIESRPKQGYFACQVEKLQETAPPALKREQLIARPCRIDFSASRVDEKHFPSSVWRRMIRSALDEPHIFRQCPPQGDEALRESVAKYLYEARGIHCEPDEIVIGAGTDHLIHILSYILDSAYLFALENPVYNKAYYTFVRMGHSVLPVEVDQEGIQPCLLPDRDNIAVYATLSHQFPLGMTVPINRRIQLLNWAKQAPHRYLIEDDYDSEFRYNARPIPPIHTLDGGRQVIYLGTFSRTVAPSLRISYMVLPRELMERFNAEYRHFGSTVSTLEQVALDGFIRGGHYERYLNRMRKLYGKKREAFMAYARELSLKLIGDAAGHHILLDTECSAEAVLRRLEEKDVKAYSIAPYFIGRPPEKYLSLILLGFGALEEEEIAEGLSILARTMKEVRH